MVSRRPAAALPILNDTDGAPKVDARALHGWLGIGKVFAPWLPPILASYAFEPGTDFFPKTEKTKGRPRKDYLLTLDVAKEIAMIGNTPQGRATRRYFIAAEKAAVRMAAVLLI